MWHEGVRWRHVESDILKEGPGTKHPGRWGIVKHQILSVKVLFKTNSKSHKHPGIKLLSSESKTQLVNQRKQNSYRKCIYVYIYICIYIYILTQSFWTGTKVIRRKHIIQPTGFGSSSSTCCQWDGEDVPAPWERSNSHPQNNDDDNNDNNIMIMIMIMQFGDG